MCVIFSSFSYIRKGYFATLSDVLAEISRWSGFRDGTTENVVSCEGKIVKCDVRRELIFIWTFG